MWAIGLVMMGVMFFGMFAAGGSHHGVRSGRGSVHETEQMDHGQRQDRGGQHMMMHDVQNQGGHDHGGTTTGARDGNKAKEESSSGELREREGQQPMIQDGHGHGGTAFESSDNPQKM
ncbi:MAG: hypothetical protein Q8O19_04330 [Rectinemataceae bacterium]|nr:hypothetical protein [Rectinemataceae bacterium]